MTELQSSREDGFQMPSSQPVLLKALRFEIVATLALMLVFGLVGFAVAETPGVAGGVLGAGVAGMLSLVTIGSIAWANHRFIDQANYIVIFFAIVAGGWLVKLIVFIVLVALLREQTWLDTKMMFFSLVAGILVSLVVDVIVATKSRLPYASDTSH